MTKGHSRKTRKAPPIGVWMAFLAAAIQVLLPFLLAIEIAQAGPRIDAESAGALCLASHATDDSSNGKTGQHPSPGCCPICQTAAVAQAFTQPPELGLPTPSAAIVIALSPAPSLLPTFVSAVPYQSRAPPPSI